MIQTGGTTQLGLFDFKGEVGKAIERFENTGGLISAPTLTALQAITPEFDYQLARVDDTGDEYRWNPTLTTTVKWEATGRNFLNEAKEDASIKAETAELNANEYTDQKSVDFIAKEKASNDELLTAITDIAGLLTWLQVNKNGNPTIDAAYRIVDALDKTNQALLRKEKNEDMLFAILDSFDIPTWLQVNKNGNPTIDSAARIANVIKTLNIFMQNVYIDSDYYYALLDVFNVPTSLSLRKDGSFSEIAIRDIQSRINLSASSKAFSDTTKLAVWGSSSMDYSQAQWRQLAMDFGIASYWQGGKGGETVETTCARHGSVPMLCKFSAGKILATSNNQTFTASNIFYGAGSLMQYEAKILEATGLISYSGSGNTFIFKRTDGGAEITLDANKEYPAISVAGLNYQNAIGIINIGKNNLTAGNASFNSPEYVLEYTKKAYEYMKPYYKFVLVLGHFVDTEQDAAAKARVLQCNTLLKDYFKERFYDLEAYLSSEKIWLDTGITPTSADLAKQAAHQKPASLSLDNGHMNTAANIAVILIEIKNLLKSYGWYNSIGA